MGTANHFDRVELPTLLLSTVAIILKRQSTAVSFERFLSGRELSAQELGLWRETFSDKISGGRALGRAYLGEYHLGSTQLLLPSLSRGDPSLPDPDVFFQAHGFRTAKLISDLESKSLAEILDMKRNETVEDTLSAEARSLLELMSVDSSGWVEGWIRSERLEGLNDAAFAIALGQSIPMDEATGLPFLYDKESGVVSLPTNDKFPKEEKAVNVPRVKRD